MMARTALMIAAVILSTGAEAQVSTQKPGRYEGPFGSDWARPIPETGGYFYMDPRTQNQRRGRTLDPRCPAGTTYMPSRGCR